MQREEIVNKFKTLSKQSIELVWVLAPIVVGRKYQEWGFKTLGEWIEEDLANKSDPSKNLVSRSYGYALCEVGRVFHGYKDRLNKLAVENKVGIRNLIEMVEYAKKGTPPSELVEMLESNKWTEHVADKKSDLRKVEIWLNEDDYKSLTMSATLYAVLYGHKNIQDSIKAMALSAIPDLVREYKASDSTYRRFDELIFDGLFRCKLCKDIPQAPTLHHLFPKSHGHGFGKLVVLCEEPCHYNIVQPQWQKFCKKWWMEPDEIQQKVDGIITQYGYIPETMLENEII